MILKKISHEITENQKILSQWAAFFSTKIENDRIICSNGAVSAFEFDDFQILVAQIKLDEPIEVERKAEPLRDFYPVLFSDTLTFEPEENNKIRAVPQKSKLTGIFYSNADDRITYPAGIPFSLIAIRVKKNGLLKFNTPDGENSFLSMFETHPSFFRYANLTLQMRMCYGEILKLAPCGQEAISRNLVFSYSWMLFSLFMQSLASNGTFVSDTFDYQKKIQMIKVKDIVLEDVASLISMDELSKVIGMSPTYIRRYFKEVFGTNITAFHQHYRMEQAYQMLLEDNKTISEVADVLGYSNAGHFSGVFKKYFGKSPKYVSRD